MSSHPQQNDINGCNSITITKGDELEWLASTVRKCKSFISPSQSFKLSVKNIFHPVNASDLAEVIGAIQRLEAIKFRSVVVMGDFSLLIRALANCRALKSFECHGLQFLRNRREGILELSTALGQLPRLESLSLAPPRARGAIETMTLVLRNPTNCLRRVMISDKSASLPEHQRKLRLLFTACQGCRNLEELVIGKHNFHVKEFHENAALALAKLLRKTQTLQKLTIYVDLIGHLSIVAESLKYNNSLVEFHLEGRVLDMTQNFEMFYNEVGAFRAGLRGNMTLQKLIVYPWTIQKSETELVNGDSWAMVHNSIFADELSFMMENHSLLDGHRSYNFQVNLATVYFYLALNKAGRAKLKGSQRRLASADDWWKSITNQDDPSVIFYFLRDNLDLFLQGRKHSENSMQRFLSNWLRTGSGLSNLKKKETTGSQEASKHSRPALPAMDLRLAKRHRSEYV